MPTLVSTVAVISVSETFFSAVQPGIESRRTAGSFSASQTLARGASILTSPDISMIVPSLKAPSGHFRYSDRCRDRQLPRLARGARIDLGVTPWWHGELGRGKGRFLLPSLAFRRGKAR